MDSAPFSRRSRACNTHLAVRGLPPNIDEQGLCEVFSKFGEVQSCSILPCHQHSDTNEALVVFFSALHAQEAALALNGAPTSRGILEISALPASPGTEVSEASLRDVRTGLQEIVQYTVSRYVLAFPKAR